MKKLFPMTLLCMAAVGLVVCSISAKEAEKSLADELAEVRATIAAKQEALADRTKELWRQQHDLEYSDPVASRLREEIKEMEKEILAKRRELDERLRTLPEWREINKKRTALFHEVQELKEQEQLILNEIAAAEYKDEGGR